MFASFEDFRYTKSCPNGHDSFVKFTSSGFVIEGKNYIAGNHHCLFCDTELKFSKKEVAKNTSLV